MSAPPLFDAALFDLDGTLVATDRFWVSAARTGCRKAFRELGLEREVPSPEAWMSLVGLPADEGFAGLFADLPAAQVAHIAEACAAEEQKLLAGGGAAPMPGALELLERLRDQGLRIGIASNCSQSYLDHMLERLELGRFVDLALCLDSPGIAHKAGMLAECLRAFGTRSAFMVGDRSGDREAAWENGLPHVHCAFGFAPSGEGDGAEATIEDLGELPARLEGRRSWIEDAFERAGALLSLRSAGGPVALGVTGRSAAGKTLFARDAARVFADHGIPCRAVSLDDFAHAAVGAPPGPEEDVLGHVFDAERLTADVLEPHARGTTDEVLLLEGPFLLDPRLRPYLARIVYLTVPEEVSLRRAAARTAPDGDPGPVLRVRGTLLPAERALEERYDPARHADLVLDGSNPLGRHGG